MLSLFQLRNARLLTDVDVVALGHEPKVMPDFDKAKKQNAEQAEAETA